MPEVTFSLSDDVLREIDQAALEQGRTRSELLREAIEHYLREKGRLHRWEDPVVLNAVATQRRIAGLGEGQQFDVVAEVQKMRESRR